MLYWLFQQLAEVNPGFNVFAYITLRTILGAVAAKLRKRAVLEIIG